MKFQALIAFGFLFQIIAGEGLVSSLLDLLGLTGNRCTPLEERVQKCYDGCADVFKRYPNQIFDIGDNLMDSFKSYIDVSEMWNKSNSTIMSTRSTDLLEAIGLLSNLGTSPSYSLYVLRSATPKLFQAYRGIVSNLPEYIDQLIQPVNDALTDLEKSFVDLFNQFNRLCLINCNNFDFKRIMKSGQHLANTISFIVDTALNGTCVNESLANDTYEAIAILICILFDNFLNIQGAIISKAAALKSLSYDIPDVHYSCLLSLDPFIRGIAGSMNTVTVDIARGVRDISASLVDHIDDLNNNLQTLLGLFEGVGITVEYVLGNLLKTG